MCRLQCVQRDFTAKKTWWLTTLTPWGRVCLEVGGWDGPGAVMRCCRNCDFDVKFGISCVSKDVKCVIYDLVGGLEHLLFFHILGVIIPIDWYFFRGVETTNQWYMCLFLSKGSALFFGKCRDHIWESCQNHINIAPKSYQHCFKTISTSYRHHKIERNTLEKLTRYQPSLWAVSLFAFSNHREPWKSCPIPKPVREIMTLISKRFKLSKPCWIQ